MANNPGTKSYTPTSSPMFEQIEKSWNEHQAEMIAGTLSRYHFFREYVQPLDPKINEGGFYRWATKMLKDTNEQFFMNVVQNSLKYDELSSLDKKNLARTLQEKIRFYTKQLFHAKVAEFIQYPDKLAKMSLAQAQSLYRDIVREESKERELDIKEQGENRKGFLGMFILQALTNKFSPEQLARYREVVSQRINDKLKELKPVIDGDATPVQPDGGGNVEVSPQGTDSGLPRPDGSPDTGAV